MYDIKKSKHICKLDPAQSLSDKDLETMCMTKTGATIIGGTRCVTYDTVTQYMSSVRRAPAPVALAVSTVESVMPGFDFYFVPTVLNSANVKYHNGILLDALKSFGHMIDFDEVVFEGYVVMNPDSKVAQLTQANTNLTEDDIEAYAQMINAMYKLPVMYLEYSGTYGESEKVKTAASMLTDTQLFYGGGISNQ